MFTNREKIKVLQIGQIQPIAPAVPDPELVEKLKLYKTDDWAEVEVEIAPNGQLIAVSGLVALAAMKAAHVPKELRVKVVGRCREWLDFKQLVFNAYGGMEMDYPIDHPDFADWHATRGTGRTFRDLVKDLGDVEGKRILDVRCGNGWFSFELAKRGAEVTGFDKSIMIIVATKLSSVYGMPSGNPTFFDTGIAKGSYSAAIWLRGFTEDLVVDREKCLGALKRLTYMTDRIYVQVDPSKMPKDIEGPPWLLKQIGWNSAKVVAIYDLPLIRLAKVHVPLSRRIMATLKRRSIMVDSNAEAQVCPVCGSKMDFHFCSGTWRCRSCGK